MLGTRLRQHKQAMRVRRLTDYRTVGSHEKLDFREMALEPEADLPVPFGVRVGVDLVYQHDAAALDIGLAILVNAVRPSKPYTLIRWRRMSASRASAER